MRSIILICLLFSQTVSAEIYVSPWSVNFGNVRQGSHFNRKLVYVTNLAEKDVQIEVFDTCSLDFRIREQCYYKLRKNERCMIEIEAETRRIGYHSCVIWISDNNYNKESLRVSAQVVP